MKDGRPLQGKSNRLLDGTLVLLTGVGARLIGVRLMDLIKVSGVRGIPWTALGDLLLYDEAYADAAAVIVEVIDDDGAVEFFSRLEMTRRALLKEDEEKIVAAVESEIAKGNYDKAEGIIVNAERKYASPISQDVPIPELATSPLKLATHLRHFQG